MKNAREYFSSSIGNRGRSKCDHGFNWNQCFAFSNSEALNISISINIFILFNLEITIVSKFNFGPKTLSICVKFDFFAEISGPGSKFSNYLKNLPGKNIANISINKDD